MLLEMLILRGNYFLVSRLIYHYLKLLIGGMGVLIPYWKKINQQKIKVVKYY